MPNCFELIAKGPNTTESAVEIDEILCKILERTIDDRRYVLDWFNTIGLYLACGKSFDEIRKARNWSNEMHLIIEYLEDNYTARAWAER